VGFAFHFGEHLVHAVCVNRNIVLFIFLSLTGFVIWIFAKKSWLVFLSWTIMWILLKVLMGVLVLHDHVNVRGDGSMWYKRWNKKLLKNYWYSIKSWMLWIWFSYTHVSVSFLFSSWRSFLTDMYKKGALGLLGKSSNLVGEMRVTFNCTAKER